jgi:hypothetical protein
MFFFLFSPYGISSMYMLSYQCVACAKCVIGISGITVIFVGRIFGHT